MIEKQLLKLRARVQHGRVAILDLDRLRKIAESDRDCLHLDHEPR